MMAMSVWRGKKGIHEKRFFPMLVLDYIEWHDELMKDIVPIKNKSFSSEWEMTLLAVLSVLCIVHKESKYVYKIWRLIPLKQETML